MKIRNINILLLIFLCYFSLYAKNSVDYYDSYLDLISIEFAQQIAEYKCLSFYGEKKLWDIQKYWDTNSTISVYVFIFKEYDYDITHEELLDSLAIYNEGFDKVKQFIIDGGEENDYTKVLQGRIEGHKYLQLISKQEQFYSIYVSATKTHMPIIEWRKGLPESYTSLAACRTFLREKLGVTPDSLKFHYFGPMDVYGHSFSGYDNDVYIHIGDKLEEISIESINKLKFRVNPLEGNNKLINTMKIDQNGEIEERFEVINKSWEFFENEYKDKSLNKIEVTESILTSYVINSVPDFMAWEFDLLNSCAVMAFADVMGYWDQWGYWNLVDFSHKIESQNSPIPPEKNKGGFFDDAGLNAIDSFINDIKIALEHDTINGVTYNFLFDKLSSRMNKFTDDSQFGNNLDFNYTDEVDGCSFSELIYRINNIGPQLIHTSNFNYNDFPGGISDISGSHIVCVIGYDETKDGYSEAVCVYTNGNVIYPGPYWWSYYELSNRHSWSIIPGGSAGDFLNPPSLIYPENESTITEKRPTFNWSDVAGSIIYKIQIADNANFLNNNEYETTLSSITIDYDLSDGDYYWRVVHKNNENNWCEYNRSPSFFTVAIPPPPQYDPQLYSPNISPTLGGVNTEFTFSVGYSDLDNDPPDWVKVVIDGVAYPLSPSDTDYSDGAVFSNSAPFKFNAGIHTYRFTAQQGTNWLYAPPQGSNDYSFIVTEDGGVEGEPSLSVSPNPLYFGSMQQGGWAVDVIEIFNTGGGNLNWTAQITSGESWINIYPMSGFTPGGFIDDVDVTIYTSGLNVGQIHTGDVRISSTNGGGPIDITIQVHILNYSDIYEPNETEETAALIELNKAISGTIYPAGDIDWYKIQVMHQGILSGYVEHSGKANTFSVRYNGSYIYHENLGDNYTGPLFNLNASPGTYSIRLRDSGNDEGSTQLYTLIISFELPDNSPPTISEVNVNPIQLVIGNLCTITGRVTDASGIDQSSVNAQLQKPDENTIATVPMYDDGLNGSDQIAGDNIFTGQYLALSVFEGVYFIDIIASDTKSNNREADNVRIFEIYDFPEIVNISHYPMNPTDSNQVTVSSTITDQSNIGDVTLFYSINEGSTWIPINMTNTSGNEWSANIPPQSVNEVHYNIQAIDLLGHSKTSDIYLYPITILTNTPPEVTSVSPISGQYKDNVLLFATSNDPNRDTVTKEKYQYYLNGSTGWIDIGEDNTPGDDYFWSSGLDEATVWIRAQAFDGTDWSEDWYTGQGSFMIDNTSPMFSNWSTEPSDLNAQSSETFTMTLDITDNLSGISQNTPQLAYKIGSDLYSNYQDMTKGSGDSWSYAVSEPDVGWSGRSEETLYYKVYCEDNVENSCEEERTELIDGVLNTNLPFGDDFSDGNYNSWVLGSGTWDASTQVLKPLSHVNKHAWIGYACGNMNWTDYYLECNWGYGNGSNSNGDIWFRFQDNYPPIGTQPTNGYRFQIVDDEEYFFSLRKLVNGKEFPLDNGNIPTGLNPKHVRIEVYENNNETVINLYLNDSLLLNYIDTDVSRPQFGGICLRSYYSASNQIWDNFVAQEYSLNNTLVAYYPFNGNANDGSGNGNDGTVYGSTLIADRFGNSSNAYYFNGSNDYIKISNSNSLHLDTSATISAWINIDESTNYDVYGYRHILSKGATCGELYSDYAIGLSNFDGTLEWEAWGTESNGMTNSFISQTFWHHTTVTYDLQNVKFYIDGVLQKTSSGSYSPIRISTQPLYIGCRYESPLKGTFKGIIDDVRIYCRTLNESEVQALYQENGWLLDSVSSIDLTLDQNRQLVLSWTPVSNAIGYNVYRETSAHFILDKTFGTNRISTNTTDSDLGAEGIQWTDTDNVIGDPSVNYFYAVTAIRGSESEQSNHFGEFDFGLVTTSTTDFNEITLSLNINGVSNAAELMAAIPGCNSVARWNASLQGYEQYVPGLEFTNFNVYMGYPYYVNIMKDTVFTLLGEIATPSFNLVTTLTTDFNEVTLTLDKTNITKASELMADIPNCNSVAFWDASMQGYYQYVPALSFTDFDVRVGYPYYVNVTADVIWPGGGTPKRIIMEPEIIQKEKGSKAPHLVFGRIDIEDVGVIEKDISFRAYIMDRTEDKLDEHSSGCMVKYGYWIVQCGSFGSCWKAGEILRIELYGSEEQYRGEIEVELTYEPVDKACDIILTESEVFPTNYGLSQNYPNPFNPETTIEYQLPKKDHVKIVIYNMMGQEVKVLVDEVKAAGYYRTMWKSINNSGNKVYSGKYLIKMECQDFIQTRKLLMLK
jgi:hypothetical protein